METQDPFSKVHPALNFLYFTLVIGSSMFCLHPLVLAGAALFGTLYSMVLKGVKKVLGMYVKFLLPGLLVVALVNPAFNHYGVTPLLYLQSGNTVTLEAIVYGIVLGIVFVNSIIWFTCYNAVMTTDKFIYLFGKIVPASSLILAMVFRFIPKFNQHLKVIRNGQKSIGRDVSNGNLWQKLKASFTIFSMMITWSLENAIETADSMKARGYGLKGRTAFSLYRFDRRDGFILGYLILTGSLFFISWLSGGLYVSYNPKIIIAGVPLTSLSSIGVFSFCLLAGLPLFLTLIENYRWAQLKKQLPK